MPKPAELLLRKEIETRVNQFIDQVGVNGGLIDEQEYNYIREECRKLAKVDVFNADCYRSSIGSAANKLDDYTAAVNNLKRNNHHARALLEEFKHLINHGFTSEAFKLIPKAIDARVEIGAMEMARAFVAAGAYQSAASLILNATERREQVVVTSLFHKIKTASDALAQLGVSDGSVSAMQNIAGEILRERNLLWLGEHPNCTILESGKTPEVLIEYFVGVTPLDAAEMNWDLAERLIDHNLAQDGVSINFLGVKAS